MVLALCEPEEYRPILLVVRVVLTGYPDALLMERQPLQEVKVNAFLQDVNSLGLVTKGNTSP